MKVLKPISYKTLCNYCGAQLTFTLDDLLPPADKTDNWTKSKFLICPICNQRKETHLKFLGESEFTLKKDIEVIYEEEKEETE